MKNVGVWKFKWQMLLNANGNGLLSDALKM